MENYEVPKSYKAVMSCLSMTDFAIDEMINAERNRLSACEKCPSEIDEMTKPLWNAAASIEESKKHLLKYASNIMEDCYLKEYKSHHNLKEKSNEK